MATILAGRGWAETGHESSRERVGDEVGVRKQEWGFIMIWAMTGKRLSGDQVEIRQ